MNLYEISTVWKDQFWDNESVKLVEIDSYRKCTIFGPKFTVPTQSEF